MQVLAFVLISTVFFLQVFRSVDDGHGLGIVSDGSLQGFSYRPATSCSGPAAQQLQRPQRSLLQKAAGTLAPFGISLTSATATAHVHGPGIRADVINERSNASFADLPFTSFVGVDHAASLATRLHKADKSCWPGAHELLGNAHLLHATGMCVAQKLRNTTKGEVAIDILVVVLACAGCVVVLGIIGMTVKKADDASSSREGEDAFAAGRSRGYAGAGNRQGGSYRGTSRGAACAPNWQPQPQQQQQQYQQQQQQQRQQEPDRAPTPAPAFRSAPASQHTSPKPPARVPPSQAQMQQPAPQLQQQQQPPSQYPPTSGSPSYPTPPPSMSAPLDDVDRVTEGSPRHLCPGLLVPKGNECVVAVPMHGSVGAGGATYLSVREMSGQSVIDVELSQPVWGGNAAEGRPIVLLRAAQGPKPLIAYCKTGPESAGRKSVYVYDAHDDLFAHVTKVMTLAQTKMNSLTDLSRPCYVLTSGRIGLQLLFDGNFREHAVHITSEQRKMLADTEPCSMKFDTTGAYYRLRVTEGVDVGLLLCALLSIDHMEAR